MDGHGRSWTVITGHGRSWALMDGHFSKDAHGRSWTLMDGHLSKDAEWTLSGGWVDAGGRWEDAWKNWLRHGHGHASES